MSNIVENYHENVPSGMDLWINAKLRNKKRLSFRKSVFKARKFYNNVLMRMKEIGHDIRIKNESYYRDTRNIRQYLDKKEISEYVKYINEKDKYIEDNNNTEENKIIEQ